MILSGCSVVECKPDGHILWGSVPHGLSEISGSVDGVMGGVRCEIY